MSEQPTAKKLKVGYENNEPHEAINRSELKKLRQDDGYEERVLTVNNLQPELLELTLKSVPRVDLDHLVCLNPKWRNVILGGGKRLGQIREVRMTLFNGNMLNVVQMNGEREIFISNFNKDQIHGVFTHSLVVEPKQWPVKPLEAIEEDMQKICALAKDRIPFDKFEVSHADQILAVEELGRYREFFMRCATAKQVFVFVDQTAVFNRNLWALLNFGPSTKVILGAFGLNPTFADNDLVEMMSGAYMETSTLHLLGLGFIRNRTVVDRIVAAFIEAFRRSNDMMKIFKGLFVDVKFAWTNFQALERIGFEAVQGHPEIRLLMHSKLNWGLIAKTENVTLTSHDLTITVGQIPSDEDSDDDKY